MKNNNSVKSIYVLLSAFTRRINILLNSIKNIHFVLCNSFEILVPCTNILPSDRVSIFSGVIGTRSEIISSENKTIHFDFEFLFKKVMLFLNNNFFK